MNPDYKRERDSYKRMDRCERGGCTTQESYDDEKQRDAKFKKTKECGFINVTDPTLRNDIKRITKCPGDATNFTFWFSKMDPDHWGLTIKSIPKKSAPNDYEKQHGMIFNSQHTWKITWYSDSGMLKVAQNSKSLADNIVGGDFAEVEKIYNLYKIK